LTRFSSSRLSRRSPETCRLYSIHSRERIPWRRLFWADAALPSRLVGPEDFAHGFQRLIASACFLRRSKVQPFAMVVLQ
jgi:hypothetical protein